MNGGYCCDSRASSAAASPIAAATSPAWAGVNWQLASMSTQYFTVPGSTSEQLLAAGQVLYLPGGQLVGEIPPCRRAHAAITLM